MSSPDVPSLLPRPVHLQLGTGSVTLDAGSRVLAAAGTEPAAYLLREQLAGTGLALPVLPRSTPMLAYAESATSIALTLDPALGSEAFVLNAHDDQISIIGGDRAGLGYGGQALRQLLSPGVYRRAATRGGPWTLPSVSIADRPRFRWRGVMLDVVRHFMPKHDLLRFVDLLAVHRFNRLQLHLTDDQGWRVQIRRYPRLTEIGGWRTESQLGSGPAAHGDGRPHGGYYTQDDIREIVDYAAAHGITVIPEVELPGHVQAAIAAYPELGVTGAQLPVWTRWGVNVNVLNAEDSTVQFFRNVLDEIIELFPSEVIGIGGDECPREQWRADPRTQQLMAERGLTTESQVQSWFLAEISEHLATRGRRVLAWDEMLAGEVPADATILGWRGSAGIGAATDRGLAVVSCPDHSAYLDYRQSDGPDEPIPVSMVLTLEDVYRFDPVAPVLSPAQAALVQGGQANIWAEHMDSARVVDFYAFPRLCAMAEVLWSDETRDLPAFMDRLRHHLRRLDALGVEYRPLAGPLPWQRRPGVPGRPLTRQQRADEVTQLVAEIGVG